MKSPFRSLRKKLFNEGKLVRYLTYALGEIFLIVVGILLALKINDWNEDRKAQVEFEAYIVQLKEDVKGVISILEDKIDTAQNRFEAEMFLLRKLKGEAIELDDLERFEFVLNGLARVTELNLEVGNLGALLAGDLDTVIRDKRLTAKTREMAQSVNECIRIHNDKVRIIRMSDETFVQYRGREAPRYTSSLEMSYDLESLMGSKKFLYALENAIESTHAIGRNCRIAKTRLEEYLAVLEEYE